MAKIALAGGNRPVIISWAKRCSASAWTSPSWNSPRMSWSCLKSETTSRYAFGSQSGRNTSRR